MTGLFHVSSACRQRAALAAVAFILAACGTEPITRFHSLLPAPGERAAGARAVPAAPLWELQSVKLPPQLETPQWVVRLADDTIALLEYDRWIAPLADEVRSAVALRLAAAFSAAPPATAPGPPWRIAIELERFDAALGRAVHLEAQWTLRVASGTETALRCRAVFVQPVGPGLPALAVAQRAVVEQLGDAVAVALKGQLGIPRAQSCGPPQRG